MSDVSIIWDNVLDVVRGELTTPVFKTWFEHARPLSVDPDGVFVIGVQNEFAREWFEARYSSLIRSAASQVTGEGFDIRVVIGREAQAAEEATPADTAGTEDVGDETAALDLDQSEVRGVKDASAGEFGAKYTFDTFVIGQSNRFACTAALAVAEAPGLSYNPLFIYGGAGLGYLASYIGTIDGKVFGAMKAARRAYSEHEKVLEIDPKRHDAGLVVGTYRYVVATLPLPVRLMAYLVGFGGGTNVGLDRRLPFADAGEGVRRHMERVRHRRRAALS